MLRSTFMYTTTPFHLAPSSTTDTLFEVYLITCILKQDGLATLFSITLLTALRLNPLTGLVEHDLSWFAEIPKFS